VSKERARRRAQPEPVALLERERRQRRTQRRLRRRAVVRRLVPKRPGRTGKLFARRTPAQRATIAIGVIIALILVWTLIDSLLTRLGLTAFVLVATPILVVLTLDRRI
jgi:hypothetical protein